MEVEYIIFLDENKIEKTILNEDSTIIAEEVDIKDVLKCNKNIIGVESKITDDSLLLKNNKKKFMEIVEILHILLCDPIFSNKSIEGWERISIALFLIKIEDGEWIKINAEDIWYLKHILIYKTFPDLPDKCYYKMELEKQKE